MFCINCGGKLNEGSKFCGNCGIQVDGRKSIAQTEKEYPETKKDKQELEDSIFLKKFLSIFFITTIVCVVIFGFAGFLNEGFWERFVGTLFFTALLSIAITFFIKWYKRRFSLKHESKKDLNEKDKVFAPVSLERRIFNFMLDYFLIGIIMINLFHLDRREADWGYVLSFFGSIFLYYFIFESFFQKTPAKFITRTKVVMIDGNKPDFKHILSRTFARFIPFEALSFLGFYPVGWHDKLSKTLVVSLHYSPEDVRKISFEKNKKSFKLWKIKNQN